MNRGILLALILTASALAPGCNQGEIPVIGLDKDGNPAQVRVGNKDYSDRLGKVVASVPGATIEALSQAGARPRWMLRTAVVGIGVGAEVGIGPFKIGAVPRARLVFSNSTEPSIP